MQTFFLVCAVAGGTILIIQILLLLIGLDSGGDADFDVDVADMPEDVGGDYDVDSGEGPSGEAASSSFTAISFKTLNAFFTFFGLGGLIGGESAMGTTATLAIAIGSGLIAFYLVGYLWMLLYRLQSHGNVNLRNAVGTTGRVYLRIPAKGEGRGKVTITVQQRTLETSALSQGEEIPTGTPVRVVGLVGSDTVVVIPAEGNVEDNKEGSDA